MVNPNSTKEEIVLVGNHIRQQENLIIARKSAHKQVKSNRRGSAIPGVCLTSFRLNSTHFNVSMMSCPSSAFSFKKSIDNLTNGILSHVRIPQKVH
jgi:riboflavin synthase alpha subunit